MFNIRTLADFLQKFGTTVLKAAYSTPDQYKEAINSYLEGTHFIFDRERFYQDGSIVSLNWDLDRDDIAAMLRLPQHVATAKGVPFYVILKEFQAILFADDHEDFLSVMEDVFRERHLQPHTS